jgi:hypothetical protein
MTAPDARALAEAMAEALDRHERETARVNAAGDLSQRIRTWVGERNDRVIARTPVASRLGVGSVDIDARGDASRDEAGRFTGGFDGGSRGEGVPGDPEGTRSEQANAAMRDWHTRRKVGGA